MNNQDLLYNIALTVHEVDDVMNALADKANLLADIQKKIYSQAIQQKDAFDKFAAEAKATEYEPYEPPVAETENVEEMPTEDLVVIDSIDEVIEPKKNKKGKEVSE